MGNTRLGFLWPSPGEEIQLPGLDDSTFFLPYIVFLPLLLGPSSYLATHHPCYHTLHLVYSQLLFPPGGQCSL